MPRKKPTRQKAVQAPRRAAARTSGLSAKTPPGPQAARKPRPESVPEPAAAQSPDRDVETLRESVDSILRELRGIKQTVEAATTPPASADQVPEQSVNALRRLLSDLIERQTESLIVQLVEVRTATGPAAKPEHIGERLDRMLADLGAARFDARPMDILDPMLHTVVEERRLANLPDGVIVYNVRSGYRTSRGLVVAKAGVAVNRLD